MIHSARDLDGDRRIECDVVVVGTGAGGGMVARDCARAGLRVVALEEGRHSTPRDFTQRERQMLSLLFQDQGGRTTHDGAIAILQGRGVGGSTVHNTNLCKRTPDRILADWAERFGLGEWAPEKVEGDFAAVERDLSVSLIEPAKVNRNNDLLRRGMAVLGWRGGVLHHNRTGCIGSGYCELGCAYDGKNNVPKVLLPDALAHGAEVWADCRATRVTVESGRASGVIARAILTDDRGEKRLGPTVTVRARAVVLSGSAIGSPLLALASDLPNRHGLVGRNLHLHPAAAVAGVFDEPVRGWMGIPQSVECTEWIDFEPGSPKRIWITTAFAHPIGMASMVPGFGARHMALVRRYPHLAVLIPMLHDESAGEVRAQRSSLGARPDVRYTLGEADRRALVEGMAHCARLLLAAGAREVMVPTARPLTVRSEADLARVREHEVRVLDPALAASHPMGTLPMAADPARGVTDGRGAWHGLGGLYVADGSLLPTSIGGPPQITIYTAGRRVARSVVEDLRPA